MSHSQRRGVVCLVFRLILWTRHPNKTTSIFHLPSPISHTLSLPPSLSCSLLLFISVNWDWGIQQGIMPASSFPPICSRLCFAVFPLRLSKACYLSSSAPRYIPPFRGCVRCGQNGIRLIDDDLPYSDLSRFSHIWLFRAGMGHRTVQAMARAGRGRS